VVAGVAALVSIGLLADLGKQDWAAWVQAVGSIAAILATIEVMRRQHLAAIELQDRQHAADNASQERRRRDDEILQCHRALLAIEGYFNALKEFRSYLAKLPPDATRDFNVITAPIEFFGPLDSIDTSSMAFLVGRNAQDMLNELSRIRGDMQTWHNLYNSVDRFMRDEINPLLKKAEHLKGEALGETEMLQAVGKVRADALHRRTHDLRNLTMVLGGRVHIGMARIRERVVELYPDAVLPAPKE
jgi:hypothetical protein